MTQRRPRRPKDVSERMMEVHQNDPWWMPYADPIDVLDEPSAWHRIALLTHSRTRNPQRRPSSMSDATPSRPTYLIAEEAAAFLRVPVATLYAWRSKRTGPPARRVGKRLLYREDELIEWVESQCR